MATKHRVSRAMVIAASCLAVAAPAAQARPIGLVPGSQPGTWKAVPTTTGRSVLSEPIHVATATSNDGFSWVDAAIGAAAAATLLGLGRVASARVRPRRAATS